MGPLMSHHLVMNWPLIGLTNYKHIIHVRQIKNRYQIKKHYFLYNNLKKSDPFNNLTIKYAIFVILNT